MGSHQHRGAELDCLDGILPPVRNERAADKGDRCERIEQAELSDRVGDIDVGPRLRQLPLRAERDVEICRPELLGDKRPALWMTRHDDGEEISRPWLHLDMCR